MNVRNAFAICAFLACTACGAERDVAPGACGPFDQGARPIALERVLGVGRDAEGTLYALDETDDEVRAFVSAGELLLRQPVDGHGHGRSGSLEYYDVSIVAEPPYRLYLELPDEGEPRFLKTQSEERSMPGEVIEGEELEIVSASALDELELRDLPPSIRVEYLGSLADGRHVLVTVPENDFSYENFRAFVGEKDAMVEHAVLSVDRRRDGGSTTIEIEIDGGRATLDFPVVRDSAGQVMPGSATFDENGELLAIELLPDNPTALAQHSFVCE